MNLNLAEPLLDSMAAAMGVLGALIAFLVAIRQLRQQAKKPSFALATDYGNITFRETNTQWESPKASFSPEEREVPVAEPEEAVGLTLTPPALKFQRIAWTQDQGLKLTLQNTGSTLSFERMATEKYNELQIQYQQPLFTHRAVYAPYTSMNFVLKGSDLEMATYHFTIFFKDKEGNPYKQEVAGMGSEHPIIEPVVELIQS
ncbi:MAG: hypothetical protein AAFV78_12470 [Bacteroidota bacterium]